MRTNVDYGPAVLPVGSVLEHGRSYLLNAKAEQSAELLAAMLTGAPEFHHRPCPSEYQVKDALVSGATDESLFDETRLHTHLEKACCDMRQDKFSELSIKVAPEIIPETLLKIRKTTDGLYIDFESTSAEARHWLQSIRTRLSLHLHLKLQCFVEIDIVDGNRIMHKPDQKNLAKHARYR